MDMQCHLVNHEKNEVVDYDGETFSTTITNWIKRSDRIPLRDVPYQITYLVSRFFPPQHNWTKFATALGIECIQKLKTIEGDAYVRQKWPSEILLQYCIDNTSLTFGDLLAILYEKLHRLDCLQQLHDSNYVSEFLKKWDYKGKHPLLSPSKQFTEDGVTDMVSDSVALQKLKLQYPFQYGTPEEVLTVLCAMKKPSVKRLNTAIIKTENSGYLGKQPNDNNQIAQPISNNTPTLRSKKLVILLTYSKDASDIIPKLVERFWAAGIGVISEYVLQGKGFFETNYVTAWENFFMQSQFVVPVMSLQYLKDIQRPSSDNQSRGVRFVYDLYTRKYIKDGCLNNVVRPLLMDNVPARALNKVILNPTLEIRWQLPAELDNFVDMMKKYARNISREGEK